MKLKVILSIQPVGSEVPKISHEGVIDSSHGLWQVGGVISELLAMIWQEFRHQEPEFKKASEL